MNKRKIQQKQKPSNNVLKLDDYDEDKEIDFFLKRVEESKQGNINHYIINGVWGSLAMTKKIKGVPIFLGATL